MAARNQETEQQQSTSSENKTFSTKGATRETSDNGNKKYPTRKKRKVRYNSRYQTEDLVREISPQPTNLELNTNTSTTGPNDNINININNNDNDIVQKNVKHDIDDESNKKKGSRGDEQNAKSSENNDTTTDAANEPPIEPKTSSETIKEEVTTITTTTILVNGKRTVQCNICKRQMTESKLANHIRLLHIDKPQDETTGEDKMDPDGKRKKFRCDNCGKLYATKYTYQQHMKTHTEGRPKCPECGSTFASAFSLFRHRAKNHNLEHNYQTHCCDKCDKSFFSISELKLHQQRHSSSKEFKCEICHKAFSVKGNLKIHMRTHAKEKLYKCDICENTFSHPYSLVSHRRIHTNDFPYECPKCAKGMYRDKQTIPTTSKSVIN